MMRLSAIRGTRGMSPSEAAAHWLVRDDAGTLSAGEEAEFEAWRQDPVNAEALRRASGAMALFDGDFSADPNLRALRQAALNVAPAPRHRLKIAGGALLAASLAGVIALSAIDRGHPPAAPGARTAAAGPEIAARAPSDEYVTRTGERRSVKLADGSTVTLNTGTRLAVAFTGDRRLVRLLRGEALFEVAHDRNRPFVVEAADRQVTALGTIFDVRVDPGRVKVVLLRGRVVIDRTSEATTALQGAAPIVPAFLTPGEQFSAELGAPQRITSVNIDRQLLWRDGFVEFEDQPLAVAVAEINRYSSRPIMLDDDGVGALRLSGLYRTGAPGEFVDAVSAILPVQARAMPQGGIKLSLSASAPR
jgi:transmembrane sensor